ncbi:CHAT domain-containing protein [Mycena sp. CBHHK59/15]|nr:CHAT domain-containing protein [Mycena sp. CBHHK59/15]
MQRHQRSSDSDRGRRDAQRREKKGRGGSMFWKSASSRSGEISDLDYAISLFQQSTNRISFHNSQFPVILNNLATTLVERFAVKHDPSDLDEAIRIHQKVLVLRPTRDLYRSHLLNCLSTALLHRFECAGKILDIDNAISLLEEALDLIPDDIDKSVLMAEDAVKLTPDGHPQMPARLDTLGRSLSKRYEHTGHLPDITKAISVANDALSLIPNDHPDTLEFLTNLAIIILENAVRLTPDGHPSKPDHLNYLSSALSVRFERLGNVGDIDNSISLLQTAMQARAYKLPDDHGYMIQLGNSFTLRFKRLGDLADIDEAITIFENVVAAIPDGIPSKPSRLNNLGTSLLFRFTQTEKTPDVEKAVAAFEAVLKITSDDHPLRPEFLNNLAISLKSRFDRHGDIADINQSISLLEDAVRSGALSSTGPPRLRFQSASRWTECAWRLDHSSILEACTTVLDLLPRLAWLGLPLPERHRELIRTGNVANAVAAVCIERGEYATAVEWLEQGRSIVWGQLLQLRTPVDELQDVEPDLANRLTHVSKELDGSSSRDDLSLENSAQNHRRLTSEWEQLVKQIRSIHPFERFLLPKTLKQLTAAGLSGPVVILNISSFRYSSEVQHTSLPHFRYDDAQRLRRSLSDLLRSNGRHIFDDRLDGNRENTVPVRDTDKVFSSILSELWSNVVEPILATLKLKVLPTTKLPRMWWCPTGPLAFLPIHAAGLYNTEAPGFKLTDFAISSSIPTLGALFNTSHRETPQKLKLLAIAQPSGKSSLPGTQEELSRIEVRATTTTIKSLIDSQATVSGVLQGMKESNWVHFACHGLQNTTNPTESSLLLADEAQLKLSEIVKISLPHAELAFLSACQTATGDDHLSEEAIHLAAGMLLAGYRSVVATMWSIMDRDAPLVADDFYEYLFRSGKPDHTQAARALHYAVERLRDKKGGKSFLSWVPFIHIGV